MLRMRKRPRLLDLSDNFSFEVAQIVSCQGRRDLLRASRRTTVMRRASAELKKASGSDSTSAQSEQVD